ncbi:hypothetical protein Tco_0681152 [Tanacetum coccineum]|uniref:Uncharacterized protein n=1 Tax=Tanacetum coccineum TaxID=301880 RepID=A0ABQ4XNU6_9ASTR
MGESSRKTSLERHEEQIEEILNHLDELLSTHEHKKDKIEGSSNRSVIYNKISTINEDELQNAMHGIAKLKESQMGNNNKNCSWLAQIANLEQINEEFQVRHQSNNASPFECKYELKNCQKGQIELLDYILVFIAFNLRTG